MSVGIQESSFDTQCNMTNGFDTYLVMVQEHTRVDLNIMCMRAREDPKGTHEIRNEGERKRTSGREKHKGKVDFACLFIRLR